MFSEINFSGAFTKICGLNCPFLQKAYTDHIHELITFGIYGVNKCICVLRKSFRNSKRTNYRGVKLKPFFLVFPPGELQLSTFKIKPQAEELTIKNYF